jgi:hypothetical protein
MGHTHRAWLFGPALAYNNSQLKAACEGIARQWFIALALAQCALAIDHHLFGFSMESYLFGSSAARDFASIVILFAWGS